MRGVVVAKFLVLALSAQGLPGFGLASKKDGRPINRAVDGLPISGSAPQQEHELAETTASSTRAGAQDEQMAMVMSTTFSARTETSAGNSLAVGVLNLVADAPCGGRALLYRRGLGGAAARPEPAAPIAPPSPWIQGFNGNRMNHMPLEFLPRKPRTFPRRLPRCSPRSAPMLWRTREHKNCAP